MQFVQDYLFLQLQFVFTSTEKFAVVKYILLRKAPICTVADLCHLCFRLAIPQREKSRINKLKWLGA
jgi:hypothetical protein